MKYNEKISSKLNEILERSFDAEKGYQTAAENVENLGLKQYFQERSNERKEFSSELRNEIKKYEFNMIRSVKNMINMQFKNRTYYYSSLSPSLSSSCL